MPEIPRSFVFFVTLLFIGAGVASKFNQNLGVGIIIVTAAVAFYNYFSRSEKPKYPQREPALSKWKVWHIMLLLSLILAGGFAYALTTEVTWLKWVLGGLTIIGFIDTILFRRDDI